MHLHVHVNPSNNREEKCDAQYDGVNEVILGLRNEKGSEVDDDDLFGKSEEGCDCEMPEFNVASRKYSSGEMRWNDGETDDEDDLSMGLVVEHSVGRKRTYPESTISGQSRQSTVVEIRSFEFDGLSSESVFERIPSSNYSMLAFVQE